MTKKEFIQKAALTILQAEPKSVEFIASYACRLADAIYGEDKEEEEEKEEKEKPLKTGFENEPVSKVIAEIDRIDEEDVERRKKEAARSGYPGYFPHKKGYAFRIQGIFSYMEITTVGDLLHYGRTELYRLRNIGKSCVDVIAEALYNLYEIRL